MDTKERIEYLESRLPKGKESEIEDKYRKSFERTAGYQGNGVYNWGEIHATNTRILFLTGVLVNEGIRFKTE
jgi:hypothetical protein